MSRGIFQFVRAHKSLSSRHILSHPVVHEPGLGLLSRPEHVVKHVRAAPRSQYTCGIFALPQSLHRVRAFMDLI